MKSLRMDVSRHLYFKQLPEPEPPTGTEVLVRIKYASICGYDMMMLRGKGLIEPLMMGMYALQKANLSQGKRLIIIGCGAMGQIMLKLARIWPLSQIVIVDPIPQKREAALRFGADVAIDPTRGNVVSQALSISNLGYDSVIEASGDPFSAQDALNLVARGGSLVYFGLYGMDFNLKVNLFHLYWQDSTITAVCIPGGLFPDAVALAPRLNLKEVITAVYPFSDALEAFEEKSRGMHAKIMLAF